jgi:hypothetical protein
MTEITEDELFASKHRVSNGYLFLLLNSRARSTKTKIEIFCKVSETPFKKADAMLSLSEE